MHSRIKLSNAIFSLGLTTQELAVYASPAYDDFFSHLSRIKLSPPT